MLGWINKSTLHVEYLNLQVPRFITLGIKVSTILTSLDHWIQVSFGVVSLSNVCIKFQVSLLADLVNRNTCYMEILQQCDDGTYPE